MAKYGVLRQGIRIFSIWNEMKRIHFIVQIKYYSSNSVHTVTLFKILNDVTVYILLNPWDKIWIMKWTNREIPKWRGSYSDFIIPTKMFMLFSFSLSPNENLLSHFLFSTYTSPIIINHVFDCTWFFFSILNLNFFIKKGKKHMASYN